MASVYDYGIGNLNNTMLNFMQQQTMDKYRQFQENVGMAQEERNKQKFAWEQKKEAEMDAPVDATAFMNSQGLHPEEQKPIKDFILSMGYGQDINGRLILNHKRDVPVILKQIANQPQLNLAVDIARDNRYGNTLATIQDQMDKIMEKDPIGYPNDEKYMELVNQGNQIAKQRMILSQSITRLKTMIEKGDTSLTEPEILSLPAGNPQREAYIQGKIRLQTEKGKQIERTVDLGDKVEYIYANGTRETKPKGKIPTERTPMEQTKNELIVKGKIEDIVGKQLSKEFGKEVYDPITQSFQWPTGEDRKKVINRYNQLRGKEYKKAGLTFENETPQEILRPITPEIIKQIKAKAKTRQEAEDMARQMGYDPYQRAK